MIIVFSKLSSSMISICVHSMTSREFNSCTSRNSILTQNISVCNILLTYSSHISILHLVFHGVKTEKNQLKKLIADTSQQCTLTGLLLVPGWIHLLPSELP